MISNYKLAAAPNNIDVRKNILLSRTFGVQDSFFLYNVVKTARFAHLICILYIESEIIT